MNGESIFSRRLLIVWIVAAALTFAVSLYFMGSKDQGDTVGPSTYSRSAIGYAGIADVLQKLGVDVVKSRYDSLGKLTSGSVLVIAEPRPGPATERTIRTLLKADTVLLILPKWTGAPSRKKSGWLGEAALLSRADAAWVLRLVAPRADVVRSDQAAWTTNTLGIAPTLEAPIQLIHGDRLRPLIGDKDGMLLGEVVSQGNGQFMLLSNPSESQQKGAAVTRKHRSGCCPIPTSSPITASPRRATRRSQWRSIKRPAQRLRAASCSTRPCMASSASRQVRSCCCSAFRSCVATLQGADCDRAPAVGDAWTLRRAAAGAAGR